MMQERKWQGCAISAIPPYLMKKMSLVIPEFNARESDEPDTFGGERRYRFSPNYHPKNLYMD